MPNCSNGHPLDEPEGLLLEERQPCPECGSLNRISDRTVSDAIVAVDSASVVIRPSGIATTTHIQEPTVTTEELVETLQSIGRRLSWYRPSDEHGLWMVEVYDDAGNLLANGMGDNREDALLGIAEDVLPRDDE